MNIPKLLLALVVTAGLFAQAAHNQPTSSQPAQQSKQPDPRAAERQTVSATGGLLSLFDEAGES